jgi:hypothetical protein
MVHIYVLIVSEEHFEGVLVLMELLNEIVLVCKVEPEGIRHKDPSVSVVHIAGEWSPGEKLEEYQNGCVFGDWDHKIVDGLGHFLSWKGALVNAWGASGLRAKRMDWTLEWKLLWEFGFLGYILEA